MQSHIFSNKQNNKTIKRIRIQPRKGHIRLHDPAPFQPISTILNTYLPSTIVPILTQKLQNYMYVPPETPLPQGCYIRYIYKCARYHIQLHPGGYVIQPKTRYIKLRQRNNIIDLDREKAHIFILIWRRRAITKLEHLVNRFLLTKPNG